MKILVIIPAYNEAENIGIVIKKLNKIDLNLDYIIINDCSKDNTAQVCKLNKYPVVSLPVNLGIGGGVQTGYLYALENEYDIAIQMDGDGQHDPKYIEDLIAPIIKGNADIVIGSRFISKEGFQSSCMRRTGIRLLSNLIYLCSGVKVNDVTSGLRAVNQKYIKIFAQDYAQDYPEPEAIISAAMQGAHITEIPVIMFERYGGVSSINLWKSIYYMIKVSLAILFYRITFNRGGAIK